MREAECRRRQVAALTPLLGFSGGRRQQREGRSVCGDQHERSIFTDGLSFG